MTTQFMRNYIDLINEMQQPQPQPQQLDEGMLDFLKQKAMKLVTQVNQSSKVKPYIDLVKQQPGIQDQMMDILKSSKSADDVVAQLKQMGKTLAQQKQTVDKVSEGWGSFGAIASLIGTAASIIEYFWNPISEIIIAHNPVGVPGAIEAFAAPYIAYIFPVMFIIVGLQLMWYSSPGD